VKKSSNINADEYLVRTGKGRKDPIG
jgi:hypothetical protein